ncbi:MAG: RDD family protein [Phycisphaerae bacterium]|nr:RDD family protein [Phycisphaerae bacterium]
MRSSFGAIAYVMVALCAAIGASLGAVRGAHAGDVPTLPIASDGANIWAVAERMTAKGVERVLLHHSPLMEGAHARPVLAFREHPVGMAAAGGRVWLIMAPLDATRPRREVYTVSASVHPLTGLHVYEPLDRLAIRPSLPGVGTLDGVASIGAELTALLSAGAPQRLGPTGWTALAGAPEGRALMPWKNTAAVVTTTEPLNLWIASLDGGGTTQALDVAPGSTVLGVSGCARPTMVVRHPDGNLVLATMREQELAPLAVLTPPAGAWGIAGLADGFVILEADGAGSVSMRAVDGQTGSVGDAQALTPPPSKASQWILMVLAAILMLLLAVGCVLLLNPRRVPRDPAPYGCVPLAPMRRLCALGIDLIPGIVTALALGYPWASLVRSPIWSPTGAGAVPALVMIGVALAVCTLTELATGSSVGKWAVGGRVARMAPAGARPAVWQVLVRNLFKGFVLVVPMAVIFNVWTPGLRGIGEILTSTAVIDRRPRAQPLKPESREGR